MKTIMPIMLLFMLNGCMSLWVMKEEGAYEDKKNNFVIEIPDKNWKKLRNANFLVLTKDGTGLQSIVIQKIHISDELTNTKKKFRKGMLPHEQAQLIIDNEKSGKNIFNFKVINNKPVLIAGKNGYRILYKFNTGDKLNYMGQLYGFMEDEWAYIIFYDAPERYYYNKDLATFEKIVKSFRLLKSES